MQDVVHALYRGLRDVGLGQIAGHELGRRRSAAGAGRLERRLEVVVLAGDEVVGDADAMTAPQQLLDQMRADETGAAGDEIRRHDQMTIGDRRDDGRGYAGQVGIEKVLQSACKPNSVRLRLAASRPRAPAR